MLPGRAFAAVLVLISVVTAYPTNFTINGPRSVEGTEVEYYRFEWFPRPGSKPGDPVTAEKETAADAIWKEAIALATLAYTSVSATDPIFLRYFEAGDAALVQGMFKIISGAADGNILRGSKQFPMLWLFEGPSPFVAANICDDNYGYDAVANENQKPQTIGYLPPNYMAVSLCPRIFRLPLLLQISCSCLGGTDSFAMNSGGAIMLHEIMHWRYLTSGAPDFDTLIGPPPQKIVDYKKPATGAPFPDPPGAYGPLYAAQLVPHANGDARKNADNYRWYALNKYWNKKCGRFFLPATDNDLGEPPGETPDNTDQSSPPLAGG